MSFLVLYIDDILLIGNDVTALSIVKVWLASTFDMKDLGEASYILGIKLIRDRKRKIMGLSQAAYIDKVLTRFSMDNSKKGLLPFRHSLVFSKEQCPKTQEERSRMEGIPYASAVGILYMQCYALDQVSALPLAWLAGINRIQVQSTGQPLSIFLST